MFDKLCHKQILETAKGNKGNTKLRTYIKFKVNLNLEKYLSCVSVRADRAAVARFRMSAHQIRIKTGRYQN